MNKQKAIEVIDTYLKKSEPSSLSSDFRNLFISLIDALYDEPDKEKPIASYCEVSKMPYIGKQCPYCHFSSDEPKPEGKKLADVLQSFSLTLVRASLTNQAWILVKEDADRLAEASKAHLKSKLPEQKLAVMDFTRGGKGTDNFNFGWNSCLEAVKKAIQSC